MQVIRTPLSKKRKSFVDVVCVSITDSESRRDAYFSFTMNKKLFVDEYTLAGKFIKRYTDFDVFNEEIAKDPDMLVNAINKLIVAAESNEMITVFSYSRVEFMAIRAK